MTLWIRYKRGDKEGFGTLRDGMVTEYSGDMFAEPRPTGEEVDLSEVKLLTPTQASKMVAMANNFHALIEKFGLTVPQDPLYFLKANSSFHPTGEPIVRPAAYEGKILFEGELGIVIGKTCRNVPEEQAGDHIFGYTCVNDVTAFDLLNEDPSFAQWTRCKAADTFGVFGPAIATELDADKIRVVTKVDGQERQNYPVSDMVFTPEQLVSRVSCDMTLVPGDIIACGTSIGVGSLKPGAVVEIHIEGVGTLHNQFTG